MNLSDQFSLKKQFPSPLQYISENQKISKIIALDCEMVGPNKLNPDEHALARASIVDFDGNVLLDTYVKCDTVADYRTEYSGITPECLKDAPSFKLVQEQVANIIKNKIIVGHGLINDFKVLMLSHPSKMIRDTSLYKPLRLHNPSRTPSLKSLALWHLSENIQTNSHCSIEDARSCLNIYKLHKKRWERDIACLMYKKPK